jgi:hypothetical protein
MSEVPNARVVTLRSSKPLAPPFHRHIAKSRLMNRICRAGDRIVIYDIVATEPDGNVRVTDVTHLEFE